MFLDNLITIHSHYLKFGVEFLLTQLTVGGSSEADMATPTREAPLPPKTDMATPAPEGSAIRLPDHKLLTIPLEVLKQL